MYKLDIYSTFGLNFECWLDKPCELFVDVIPSTKENKNPLEEIELFLPYIKHIHISEIKLETISNYNKFSNIKNKLIEKGYSGIVTYEVLKNENVIDSVVEFGNFFSVNGT